MFFFQSQAIKNVLTQAFCREKLHLTEHFFSMPKIVYCAYQYLLNKKCVFLCLFIFSGNIEYGYALKPLQRVPTIYILEEKIPNTPANVPEARIAHGTAACEADTLPTELPRSVI